jgi:rare lipoprotein A
MRFLLPVVAVATALTIGTAPAAANQHSHHRQPRRANSHISLHLSSHTALRGGAVVARGRVRPGGGHHVKVVFHGPDRGVVGATTRPSGAFMVRWSPGLSGNYGVRAFGVHDAHTRGSVSKARRLTTYHPAGASYYGPGLYGNGVACGGTLEPGTLGVANKTLPCGTEVKLRYRGRSITVPVIDRGPYVAGRDYDLTEATRDRLGFPGVGMVLANR